MNLKTLILALTLGPLVEGTILQNGQVRVSDFPNTEINPAAYAFTTYDANATELSYKGRWDSKKISYWSAAGLVFGFSGDTVAITFGENTVNGTLVGYRLAGMDWTFTNVTVGGTHLFVTPETPGVNETYPVVPLRFEMHVSNWGYGVQIDQVHVASGESLIKIPPYGRTIEFIGDSLSAGDFQTYESMSSFAYGVGEGLGETEYYVTAIPGICVADQNCFGNPRGQVHQWFYSSDTSWRAAAVWGDNPEPWDFQNMKTTPDIVVINLGTNDNNVANNVSSEAYVDAYKKLIEGVHGKYPNAQVVVMELWLGFYQYGNSFAQDLGFQQELEDVVAYFNSPEYLSAPKIWDATTNTTTTLNTTCDPFVHYFRTKGILQHNDIGPQWHPTDVGAIKVASHLLQYIKLTFGWDLVSTGPEVFHDTLYWNDEDSY
ncbi:Lipase, GDSL-like protein [Xylaria sp. CBS 124048]|nr:Lipase, GDSL-like protein [Xylaria sp. CBS 124048]